VVIFNNGNTPAGNPNGQQLGVVCHPTGNSANGTAHLNCAEPTKVGDDIITGEPQCDFGRGPEECIPGAVHPHQRLSADQPEHAEQPPLRRLAGLPERGVRHPALDFEGWRHT